MRYDGSQHLNESTDISSLHALSNTGCIIHEGMTCLICTFVIYVCLVVSYHHCTLFLHHSLAGGKWAWNVFVWFTVKLNMLSALHVKFCCVSPVFFFFVVKISLMLTEACPFLTGTSTYIRLLISIFRYQPPIPPK